MSKILNLSDIQKCAMDDIKNKLNVNDNDRIYITYKKKNCNCVNCDKCFENIKIIQTFKDLKIEYESEHELNNILKDLKCINN